MYSPCPCPAGTGLSPGCVSTGGQAAGQAVVGQLLRSGLVSQVIAPSVQRPFSEGGKGGPQPNPCQTLPRRHPLLSDVFTEGTTTGGQSKGVYYRKVLTTAGKGPCRRVRWRASVWASSTASGLLLPSPRVHTLACPLPETQGPLPTAGYTRCPQRRLLPVARTPSVMVLCLR